MKKGDRDSTLAETSKSASATGDTVFDKREFFCQRCHNPLDLDTQFQSIHNAQIMALLDATDNKTSQNPTEPESSSSGAVLNVDWSTPHKMYNFTTENDQNENSSLNHRIQTNAYLFDILTERTEIEHPLCLECADTLIMAQQKQLNFQEEELNTIQSYLTYLESHSARVKDKNRRRKMELTGGSVTSDDEEDFVDCCWSTSSGDEDSELEDEDDKRSVETRNRMGSNASVPSFKLPKNIGKMNHEEADALLNELDKELQSVMKECADLEDQNAINEKELKVKEEELEVETREYNEKRMEMMQAEEKLRALELRLRYFSDQHERLVRTNLLNTLFPIWCESHIGIINGLHLGRLLNKPIEWQEINAAWGQCALLLSCIAKKLDYTFENYRLVLQGDQSKIYINSKEAEYPLYYPTNRIRLMPAKNFDIGMVAYVDCLCQVQKIIQKKVPSGLPYKVVDGDKFMESSEQLCSIRYTNNTEENWTKALKMMLINLKWVIAYMASEGNFKLNKVVRPSE